MSQTKKTDLILRNARLIDGTGASSQYGDLAILDDRLQAVGELGDVQAGRELDVAGKAVCPGFVDTHTTNPKDPLRQSLRHLSVSCKGIEVLSLFLSQFHVFEIKSFQLID